MRPTLPCGCADDERGCRGHSAVDVANIERNLDLKTYTSPRSWPRLRRNEELEQQVKSLEAQFAGERKSFEAQLAQARKALVHEQNEKHHDVFRDVLKAIAKPPSGARADYHVDIARLYADLAYPPPKAEGT